MTKSPKGREKVKEEFDATVVGEWRPETGRVMLQRADSGERFEVVAPPAIAPHLQEGAAARVYLGESQRLGWYLVDHHIGVREDLSDPS